MTKDHVQALFLLAGFNLNGRSIFQIRNEYGPEEHYGPWWLVQTQYGLIKIGWRKRVINIDWEDTPYRAGQSIFWDNRLIDSESTNRQFTKDDVTQGATYVHAWGYPKALEYLQVLRLKLRQTTINKIQYRHMWEPEDEERYLQEQVEEGLKKSS